MLKYLDANAFLRYLLNDIPEQADRVEPIIDQKQAFLAVEVMAEIVYVLEGVYAKERKTICDTLIDLGDKCLSDDCELLKEALSIYRDNKKLDLVDSVLAARHRIRHAEVFSFDRDLNRRMAMDDVR